MALGLTDGQEFPYTFSVCEEISVKRSALPLCVLLLFLLPSLAAAQRPLGPPLRVSQTARPRQGFPGLAMNAQGDFVVTWISENPPNGSGATNSAHARRFAADGTPVTDEILIAGQAEYLPQAAVLADGSFVVAFDVPSGLMVRRYGADGELERERLVVSQPRPDARIAPRQDGGFALVWARAGAVFLRLFGADDKPVGPVRRVTDRGIEAAVAVGPAGELVVSWIQITPMAGNPRFSETRLLAQRYEPNGEPRGQLIVLREKSPSAIGNSGVAKDRNGNFLAVWTAYEGDTTFRTFARRYGLNGKPLSGVLKPEQSDNSTFGAAFTMDPAGNFVLAWLGLAPSGIFAHRFTAEGASFRPVFRVDEPPLGANWEPSLASAASSDFAVAWGAGDELASDIYVQLYRKR
jgi:hypothetical protein